MEFQDWFFLISCTLCWGIAEIFYKKGSLAREKYSHLKITVLVGFFMGAYATVILFTQGVDLKAFPKNFLLYLPVSLCYIVSMACSYFGMRFLLESISDPIENSSGALVPILFAVIFREAIDIPIIVCIVVISIGVLCVGFLDKKGKTDRRAKFGKKLAVWAIAMPFCYLLLDAVGTFLDDAIYTDMELTPLVNFSDSETILNHTANCAYEFTFLLVAIGLFIFLKIKGEKLFSLGEGGDDLAGAVTKKIWVTNPDGTVVKKQVVVQPWYQKLFRQKWKLLAAAFETAGQATYLFALNAEGTPGVPAVILGSGTVITSLILSRVFLKEKLTWLQYLFIFIILSGIIALAIFDV